MPPPTEKERIAALVEENAILRSELSVLKRNERRDFAGLAMQAILSNPDYSRIIGADDAAGKRNAEQVARAAYDMADAMIEEA